MSSRANEPPRPVDEQTHALLVGAIKALTMDAVEQAQSGHPGMPMGAADMASALWTRFLAHDPSCPAWPNRDRFVLSAGHGSMLLYSLLHLTGYDLPLQELRNFRQWGSMTPGHPEVGDIPGVEITTGPLGTGFAAGVGMAIAERFLAQRYNRPGHEIIDHFTYGIVGDGDVMAGVAQEAASLAGHLGLGKLVYLYDDNHITIDGSTDLTFTEDVGRRFEAYGWHVQHVDGHDAEAVLAALVAARSESRRPSLIACRTTIAHGAPNLAGSSKSHGAPLGKDEVEATKRAMKWPVDPPFFVPDKLRSKLEAARAGLAAPRRAWEAAWKSYQADHLELARELQGLLDDELPAGVLDRMPTFDVGTKLATRKAGQAILNDLSKVHPTVVGGSADLAASNGVILPDCGSQSKENPEGRNIHFGVREHAMAGIVNGLALHGGMRPFSATFLVFSDYLRGALRLAAIMRLPVIHVYSHDSVYVGEDGPTHQPIEHTMCLRAVPGLHVVRPADANETVGAWSHALGRRRGDGPTAIVVTRQGVPVLEETRRDVSQGAYVLWQPDGVTVADLHGILIATGSEVHIALEAARSLADKGLAVRVVSMPCCEAFEAQAQAYRDEILPPDVKRRLSVEAGVTLGWGRYAAHQHGIDRFGASAPGAVVAEKLGMTAQAVLRRYLSLP
jgi:transketolase